MRQIVNIIITVMATCAILACGEKQQELVKKFHGSYIKSPILYQDRAMLSVISQFVPGSDKAKIIAEGRHDLICDHLFKKGWLSRNVNYPSVQSLLLPADKMYKGWTICIINIINQPGFFKFRTIVQCRVDLGINSFLMKEFDHNLSDDQYLKEFDGILSDLMASAQLEARKIKGEAQ